TADGWTTTNENSTYSITGFDQINGVTNQSYSLTLTGTAGPSYGQMLRGPSLVTNASALSIAASVSIDVLAGSSFGFQQWSLITNGGSLGYHSIDNFSFSQSPVLGQESTLTWTLSDADRQAFAAAATGNNGIQIIFQVGGGSGGTMYLDNLRTNVLTD